MLRTLDVVLVGAMITAATITYQIKHAAEEKLAEVRELQAAIKLQEETIDLLEADWSLLNQPSRLQRLSEAFEAELRLKPIETRADGGTRRIARTRQRLSLRWWPKTGRRRRCGHLTTGSVQP
jgi:hypothetical protein